MPSFFAPPRFYPTQSSPIYRLLKELPLVLVCSILLWAQYTLSVSLVLGYLVANRQLYGLAITIWIPFQVFWLSAVANLAACIRIGPGWVESPSQLDPEGPDKFSPRIMEPLPAPHSYELGRLQDLPRPISRPEHDPLPLTRRDLHSGPLSRPSLRPPPIRTNYEEADDDEVSSDENEPGRIPLLSAHSYAPPMRSPTGNVLMPRSPAPGPLPPYLARPTLPPPSNLSFQEQVQRQQQRVPVEPTLLATLRQGELPGRDAEEPGQMDALMCKSDGSRRFCRKCALFKADRAHHCSSCGRCVLRMDHHCPWLGGRCVGLHNHKNFLLFLVSGSLTAIIAALAAIKGLSDFVSLNHSSGDGFQLAPLNWAFLVLVGTLFGMVLSGFTAYHLYLVSVNRTTIENMERSLRVRPTPNADSSSSYALLRSNGRTLPTPHGPPDGLPSYNLPIYKSDDRLTRAERRLLEAGSAKLNVYDLGSKGANYQEIFGVDSPWWEWLLPVRPKGISDGYTYKINEEHLGKLRELTAEVRLLPSERAGELRFERP